MDRATVVFYVVLVTVTVALTVYVVAVVWLPHRGY